MDQKICIEKDGSSELVSTQEVEALTGVKFLQELFFSSFSLKEKIAKKTQKLYKAGELTRQQLWFGCYFRQEIESQKLPDIILRYIDPVLGWGVFAGRDFRKMEFIAEYSGIVRKAKRKDRENAYCFEYTLSNGVKTPYTIDAQERGGIGRFINHSEFANLQSSLATIEFVPHVVLITNKEVKKGEQFVYDYGPDYWSKRESPKDVRKI